MFHQACQQQNPALDSRYMYTGADNGWLNIFVAATLQEQLLN